MNYGIEDYPEGRPTDVQVFRSMMSKGVSGGQTPHRWRKPEGPFFATDGYEYLGAAALHHGDYALAERMYRRALGLYQRQLSEGHLYRVQAAEGLRRTLEAPR